MKIILASKSPRRREILENLGIDFEVFTTDSDVVEYTDIMLYHINNNSKPKSLDNTFHYESFIQLTENWLK